MHLHRYILNHARRVLGNATQRAFAATRIFVDRFHFGERVLESFQDFLVSRRLLSLICCRQLY